MAALQTNGFSSLEIGNGSRLGPRTLITPRERRETDRQKDRQTDRKTERQTDRQKDERERERERE